MALQCGTKAESNKTQLKNSDRYDSQGQPALHDAESDAPAGSFLQTLGFFALTGSALVIFAGLVLLNPYAKYLQLQYHRDCDSKRIEEARATIAAMDRLLATAPSDEVLTKRLAWSRLGMYPTNEQFPADQAGVGIPAAGTLSTIQYNDPPQPDPWINGLAIKLQEPSRRRGLMVMAGCMLLSAMLMFSPIRNRKKMESCS